VDSEEEDEEEEEEPISSGEEELKDMIWEEEESETGGNGLKKKSNTINLETYVETGVRHGSSIRTMVSLGENSSAKMRLKEVTIFGPKPTTFRSQDRTMVQKDAFKRSREFWPETDNFQVTGSHYGPKRSV
jgi:hypothetical protein